MDLGTIWRSCWLEWCISLNEVVSLFTSSDLNEILSTSCPLAYTCYSSNGKHCPTMWTAAILGRPQTRSRTSSAVFFYFHRALSHSENLYLFWLSAISVRPKMATCGTKNFRVTILTNPDSFGTEQTFCQQSLEKEQYLCAFYVKRLQVLSNHPIRDHCSCAMNGKYLLQMLLSHSM